MANHMINRGWMQLKDDKKGVHQSICLFCGHITKWVDKGSKVEELCCATAAKHKEMLELISKEHSAKRIELVNLANQYFLDNKKIYVDFTGKNNQRITESKELYETWQKEREIRKQIAADLEVQKRHERAIQDEINRIENAKRQAEYQRLSKIRDDAVNGYLGDATLQDLIYALIKKAKQEMRNYDSDPGYTPNEATFDDIASFLETNYTDIFYKEISRHEQEKAWDD